MPSINLQIRLGPLVRFDISGQNCTEITEALKGFEQLNKTVESMFSDLADKVYPDLGMYGDDEVQRPSRTDMS
jgi:hypothetical protein